MKPFVLAVPFSALITGLFNLGEFVPWPLAILLGAGWAVAIGLVAQWICRRPRRAAWAEDLLVAAGAIGFAFAGCGGLMAILLLKGSLTSTSLTGEALEGMFLPSIPYYIVVNSILEVLVVPLLLYVAWRPGRRRVLVLSAAALYFVMRVWTYLAFVPNRLAWADSGHSTQPLSAAERVQAADDLVLDDPRWILLLIMFALLLAAAGRSRVREGVSAS